MRTESEIDLTALVASDRPYDRAGAAGEAQRLRSLRAPYCYEGDAADEAPWPADRGCRKCPRPAPEMVVAALLERAARVSRWALPLLAIAVAWIGWQVVWYRLLPLLAIR